MLSLLGRPAGYESRETYQKKNNFRALAARITKRTTDRYITKGPDIVVFDQTGVDKLLEEIASAASVQFDEFVTKLEGKVGEYDSCELNGNFIWSHSVLTVKKSDGSIEKWKTQMITNYSKYDLAFNQFPTRKVK